MSWTVMLDPPAIAGTAPANRTALSLNSGSIMVDQKGIDWGDSQIQTYLADRRVGSVKIDFRMPNRKITIPLFLMSDPSGSPTEEQARALLQQKIGTFQMSGGWLMRQRAGGPATYADIIDAVLTLPDVWGETGAVEPNINLILEASPDFYGDEIALDLATVSSGCLTGPLQLSGSNAIIQGDHMGRANIIVTDTSGYDQTSLIWAFRETYYDPSSTAALVYSASNLNPVSPAAVTTVAGRSGVQLTGLTTSPAWSPIVSTDVGGTSPMTHLGSYRVRARVYTSSTSNVWLRLTWGVGAAVGVTSNDLVLVPGSSNFYIIDLGEIRVDYPPIGTLRWEGQIQGQGQNGNENVFIDQLYLQPLDDASGYGTANASVSSLVSPVNRDFFTQAAGNLNGQTPNLPTTGAGNTWAESTAGLFVVNATYHCVTAGPSAVTAPHYAVVGQSTYTDIDVACDIAFSDFQAGSYGGVIARYASATQWFGACIYCQVTHGTMQVLMQKMKAGVLTTPSAVVVPTLPKWPTFAHLELVISDTGIARCYLNGQAAGLINDPDLATAGPGLLEQGQTGIWEQGTVTGVTRYYDNFTAYPIATNDAVVFAHSSAALRYDGMYRSDTTNTYFGPISNVVGDLPRLPPSGVENRPVELFLLLSRGDLAQQADLSLASFTAQVRYRPVHIHRA